MEINLVFFNKKSPDSLVLMEAYWSLVLTDLEEAMGPFYLLTSGKPGDPCFLLTSGRLWAPIIHFLVKRGHWASGIY